MPGLYRRKSINEYKIKNKMSEKWWDMSDDELDDLFREASDKVDVPFESSSFDKLRQKIDIQRKPKPAQGYKKRWLVLITGLFLMVGVGLVYRFGNGLRENNSKEIVKNENTPKRLDILSSDEIQNKDSKLSKSKKLVNENEILSLPKKNLTEKSDSALAASKEAKRLLSSQITKENLEWLSVETPKTKGITEEKSDSPLLEYKEGKILLSVPSPTTKEQDKMVENLYFDSKSNKKQLYRFNNSKKDKDREGNNYALNSLIIKQNVSSIIENVITIPEKLESEKISNRTNFYDVDFLKNKDLKSTVTNVNIKSPDFVDSLPRTIKPIRFSKVGMRLVISPDFNSIENMGNMALGGSFGLLFEYKISKKLVIQTGMVYSKKSYVGSFDDYRNWKEWKGYHPSKPIQVDGGCTVFDIPINLRLNLFQKPKQTWFVSSGVSSYWMMNENYTYNYAWSPSRAVDWSDNSKFYFSVMNFSVGMERQISKRFSLQVEPYLKTPLKNVGRGGVNLYSSGLLFSTKYEF